jgi:hypothetical protein
MFYLNGIPICIRQLDLIDLKYSFYDVMALTSEENIQLINTRNFTELFHKLNNDHKIFVIINLNTNGVIGTGTIKILNQNSMYSVCIIKYIKIHKEYYNSDNKPGVNENEEDLYMIFLQYLIDYSRCQEKCVKYIVKIDADTSDNDNDNDTHDDDKSYNDKS